MNETIPDEIMTLAEIENQFDGERVLAEDPKYTQNLDFRRG